MSKNNDLVDIIYSETIDRYVIIVKRFPNIPVIIYLNDKLDNDFNYLYDKINSEEKLIYHCIFDSRNEYNIEKNTYYSLDLYNNDDSCLCKRNKDNHGIINKLPIIKLERNEIINKMLELRKILIERGEITYEE